jgi:prepilin peptidase CpaA
MTSTSLILSIPFAAIMLLAAASDLRTRRIPNVLTVVGALAAPLLWGLVEGPMAATAAIVGGGLALLVGMPLFALGGLGGGDAKLLVVMGAFLGPSRLVPALIATGISGALMALAVTIGRGQLRASLAGTWSVALSLVTLGRRGTARTIDSSGALTIPYGVVIAAGGLFTWFVLSPELIAR